MYMYYVCMYVLYVCVRSKLRCVGKFFVHNWALLYVCRSVMLCLCVYDMCVCMYVCYVMYVCMLRYVCA